MCIRDSFYELKIIHGHGTGVMKKEVWKMLREYKDVKKYWHCLLYTSDAADERSSVDLGGRRIIKKKNKEIIETQKYNPQIQLKHYIRPIVINRYHDSN